MHPQWQLIEDQEDIAEIESISMQAPCLIFKHSTQCSISAIAKLRLESDWDFSPDQLRPYYLDLLSHRDISNYIAEHFRVTHESPQILLIDKGECIYDASHLDISVADLRSVESLAH